MKGNSGNNISTIVTVVSSKELRIDAEQIVKSNQGFLDFSMKTSIEELNDFFFNKPELQDSFQNNIKNLNIEIASFEQLSTLNAKQINIKSFDNFDNKQSSDPSINENQDLLESYEMIESDEEYEDDGEFEEELEDMDEEDFEEEFYEDDLFDEEFEEELALLEAELEEDFDEDFDEDFEEDFDEEFDEEFDEGLDEFWEEDYFLDFFIEEEEDCGELTETEVYDELLFLTGMTPEELDFIIDFDFGGDICLFYDEYMGG